jgi:riboflavin synthase
VGPESLAVTSLGSLKSGSRVHLERAMRLSDRLGGHMVSGHVDGMGTLVDKAPLGTALNLRFEAPPAILRLCIHKGAIAIDGVSLTLNVVDERGFEVCLIPHTLDRTFLLDLPVGTRVNLENDLVGKYIERLVRGDSKPGGVTWDLLSKSGFVDGGSRE